MKGVYLWAVELGDVFLPLDVGESKARPGLRSRLQTHRDRLGEGLDYIYDAGELLQGRVVPLHVPDRLVLPEEARKSAGGRFAAAIRFFVAAVEDDPTTRPPSFDGKPISYERFVRRIEAETARGIWADERANKVFNPTWKSYRPRVAEEVPAIVAVTWDKSLAGLRSVMWV